MPAGRKPKTLTEAQKNQVEALAAYLTQDQIAEYFGITRPTFVAMMERDEEISLLYKKGKARAIADVGHNLLQQARSGDLGAMCFYLKTQAGWAEKQKFEHTGEDGGPIAIKTIERRIIDPDA